MGRVRSDTKSYSSGRYWPQCTDALSAVGVAIQWAGHAANDYCSDGACVHRMCTRKQPTKKVKEGPSRASLHTWAVSVVEREGWCKMTGSPEAKEGN